MVHMNTTHTSPRTYTEAIKVAEHLSAEDLAAALNAARSFTVLGARRPLRYAGGAESMVHTAPATGRQSVGVCYSYCDRKGYTKDGAEFVSTYSFGISRGVVFHLYNEDRFVTLAH